MWDPAGAPLATWLPGIRQNLDALPVDVFQTVGFDAHHPGERFLAQLAAGDPLHVSLLEADWESALARV